MNYVSLIEKSDSTTGGSSRRETRYREQWRSKSVEVLQMGEIRSHQQQPVDFMGQNSPPSLPKTESHLAKQNPASSRIPSKLFNFNEILEEEGQIITPTANPKPTLILHTIITDVEWRRQAPSLYPSLNHNLASIGTEIQENARQGTTPTHHNQAEPNQNLPGEEVMQTHELLIPREPHIPTPYLAETVGTQAPLQTNGGEEDLNGDRKEIHKCQTHYEENTLIHTPSITLGQLHSLNYEVALIDHVIGSSRAMQKRKGETVEENISGKRPKGHVEERACIFRLCQLLVNQLTKGKNLLMVRRKQVDQNTKI